MIPIGVMSTSHPECDPENGEWDGCPPVDPSQVQDVINDMYDYALGSGDNLCFDLVSAFENSGAIERVRAMPSAYYWGGYAEATDWIGLNSALFSSPSYAHSLVETAFHEAAHNHYGSYNTEHLAEDAERRCANY